MVYFKGLFTKSPTLLRHVYNTYHVIGVCLLSQSAPGKHNQEKKSPHTFAHLVNFIEMCLPCLIIMQSCYFDYRINNTFVCSRRLIAFLALSLYLGVLLAQRILGIYLNYPQISGVGNSDPMDRTAEDRPSKNSVYICAVVVFMWKRLLENAFV